MVQRRSLTLLTIYLVGHGIITYTKAMLQCPGKDRECSDHGSCVTSEHDGHVCNCEWGYTGNDCATRMCPHGYDPDSPKTESPRLLWKIKAGDRAATDMFGTLQLSFYGHTIAAPNNVIQMNDMECTNLFQELNALDRAECVRRTKTSDSLAEFEITLQSFPTDPVMNNIYAHEGNPAASDFSCGTSQAVANSESINLLDTSIYCTFETVSDDDAVRPFTPCSSHGHCDGNTGYCMCMDEYDGNNCEKLPNKENVQLISSRDVNFHGSLLQFDAVQSPSDEFKIINADAGYSDVFTMYGDGRTILHCGSFTVEDGGFIVDHKGVKVSPDRQLLIDRSNLVIQDGAILLKDERKGLDAFIQAESNGRGFLEFTQTSRLDDDPVPIMDVDSAGRLHIHQGGLQVANGGLDLQNGNLSIGMDGMEMNGGHLSILNGGIHLRSSMHGEERWAWSKDDPVSALLHVMTDREEKSVLHFTSLGPEGEEFPTFNIKGTGETTIHRGGLTIHSGGLEIGAGGQRILSGGLWIEAGGLHVENGKFTVEDGFEITDGGFQVQTHNINGPVLQVKANNHQFAGALIELSTNIQWSNDGDQFHRLIEVKDSEGLSIFTIDAQGSLSTRGNIKTEGRAGIDSAGPMHIGSSFALHIKRIKADSQIVLPPDATYVQVVSDGVKRTNILSFEKKFAVGQLLIIQNLDDDLLQGDDFQIPSGATSLFLFDGTSWQALTTSSRSTPASIPTQETEQPSENVNFGDVKVKATSLQAGSQPKGKVAIYGRGGELSHHSSVSFDDTTELLSVENFQTKQIIGVIDASQSEWRGLDVVGGHFRAVNLTDVTNVQIEGELIVTSVIPSYFGGDVHVDGQVMGSGAYVDASDARLKKDITPILDAATLVEQMQGVEYSFIDSRKNQEREIGFLAQDMESVLPQVVATDGQGYKYIAYAHIVPVLVEAFKEHTTKEQELRTQVDVLKTEVMHLRQEFAALQHKLGRILHFSTTKE